MAVNAGAWETILGYWRAGGFLMAPLAVVTFLIWWRYLTLFGCLRGALGTPDTCVDDMETRLSRDRHDARVGEWLANLPGAVPRVARHALARVAAGLDIREAFRQCRDEELGLYTHAFYVFGALVTAAPLLGLLGTVLGMIETFDAVGARSGDTGHMVASGISQALITTQVGLVAALPGALGLAHLFRLYRRLRHQIDRCESHLCMVLERAPGALPRPGETA